MKATSSLTLLVAVALIAAPEDKALAASVNGSIGFNGSAAFSQVGGISGSSTVSFNNPMVVDIRTGDYTGIPFNTPANFAPISWSGSGTSVVLTSSNSPEWTIIHAGVTYQYSIISLQAATLNMALGWVAITGQGVVTISGTINRDPTPITFSVQGTGGGSAATFTMVQASGGPVLRTPESGSALALLASGAIGLGVLRLRWRKA